MSLASSLEQLLEKQQAKARRFEAASNRVKEWQTSAASSHPKFADPKIGAVMVPPMQSGSLQTFDFTAPVVEIAQRALSSNTYEAKRKNICSELLEAWRARHSGIRADDTEPIKAPCPRVSTCRLAGFCLHTPHGQALAKLVERLEDCLNCRSGFFKKIHGEVQL